ncbi:MAG: HutD family protein [Sphingomonadales bacterium]|nr:HutD family protein [Sphingomonadales bacterium]
MAHHHNPTPSLRMLPASARVATPWKNGGGKTWEIASFPPGSALHDFAWRISTAEVDVAGAFSNFAQVDRILTVLEGRLELRYVDQGSSVILEPGQSHAFPGDTAIEGHPLGGAVRDLNVMVRRGARQAEMTTHCPPHSPGATVIAIASQPSEGFAALDAAVLEGDTSPPADFVGYFVSLRRA